MSIPGRILVVEDVDAERRAEMQLLKAEGLTVFGAESADKALGYVEENIDVVMSDLNMGDVSGLDLLRLWKSRCPRTRFILVTGNKEVEQAVEAMRQGAYHYVTKPVNPEELILLVHRAIQEMRRDEELDNLRGRLDQRYGLDAIVGQSKKMRDVFARIQRAAAVDSTVLILGESGTGKELVAQALHHNSPRKKGAFVAVNCAAVPATLVESELFGHVKGAFTGATDRRVGRFEQADGGTLFIDEIGDFELGLQAKLLRVLETLTVTPVGGHEDIKVNVRVLAATSRDIRKMVEDGRFRQDLFYRLNVVSIELPPLRDRVDDIPLLIEHFIKEIAEVKHAQTKKVDPVLMRRLMTYRWQGNVRELRNVLESMMVLAEGDTLTLNDLPDQVMDSSAAVASARRELPTGMSLEDLERLAITKALEQCGGKRTRAAESLGISVRTLQRKLRQYQMESQAAGLA